ncbi:MDR family oxidoreductase [Piscinibacter gummiphilus]|uniref:NADPH:quinone dehydrogenase n=1 Tax=Piscinibacter gummiphilus TaxID=946333 RepID=A0A1W6L6B9_9BURK|nr:MDR family oxidoreductase [Piscinibacter gummiphilus]ARN19762.1 NADPH:quinone dehydrogenase [Piscinibacter gummiphilus]ATU64435.1 oxidoreductase [Piscinibacter gummiphilus]GLS95167.1 alcohol dehydrogenase [Piscinibacter gummiphilus]
MGSFKGVRVTQADGKLTASVVSLDDTDLDPGDVTIAVEYSTVNYKDGLAITGLGGFIKRFPMTPGIDLAGTVLESSHPGFKAGDKVVLNGREAGVTHHGGFAQRARVPGDWLVKLPSGISTRQAAAIGTAGFAAMLCVLALERNGVTGGQVLVTGAAGGVGSVAIALLAKRGYRVLASTGRASEEAYLRNLGAAEIIDRSTLSAAAERPLGMERWDGAVDTVGSHTLVNVLAQTRYGGAVAACGLAQGMDLPGSMAPYILRGVTLAGIDTVNAPMRAREQAWARLATDLDGSLLEGMTSTVGLDGAAAKAVQVLQGAVRGRTLVDVNR